MRRITGTTPDVEGYGTTAEESTGGADDTTSLELGTNRLFNN